MQVASHGVRAATRNASRKLALEKPGAVGRTTHGIHIPSTRIHPRVPIPGIAQKLFTQSHNLLAQLFTLLTAPGLHVSSAASYGVGSQFRATIQQRFSLPVRTALSRPLQPYCLPRAPGPVSRGITQVGLGTARSFHYGRPIFQNLIENVPITGRAFCEVDWEVKMRQERDMMRTLSREKKVGNQPAAKEMLKPKVQNILKPASQSSVIDAELEHYFPAPTTHDVTTCLLIPLAPTPTNRVPLSEYSSCNPSLLPLPALVSMHSSHETHALRVSTLFARLDAGNVWERGVQCSAYSQAGGSEGVCTVLKVEFAGWNKAEVRSVIGESGTGWCVLEEVRTNMHGDREDFDSDDMLSDSSSDSSDMFGDNSSDNFVETGIDPARSLVLPMLDFSSSFIASTSPSSSISPASLQL